MESKNGQCFRGRKVAASSDDVCMLQYSLNSDCLLKICEFLDVRDLVQLCKLGPYFYDLITSQYIPKKIISIRELDNMRDWNNRLALQQLYIETFQIFGKFMRKITVRGEDFGLFLDLVMRYCIEGRLSEVDLQFNSSSASSEKIDQSIPFFGNLHTLKLFAMSFDGTFQLFLAKLADYKSFGLNLETLHLRRINIKGGWLAKVRSLRQLSIESPRILSCKELLICCEANPQLKIFEYKGKDDLSEFYNSLPQLCPQLEEFIDFHKYRSGAADRYKCFKDFKNLVLVGVTSCTESGHDLDDPLRRLASRASVEKLGIFMQSNRPIALSAYQKERIVGLGPLRLQNLKGINIEIESTGHQYFDNCDVRCEYVHHLIRQCPNIESIKIRGLLSNVNSTLCISTNIRRFCIAETSFWDEQSELQSIMDSINTLRSNGNRSFYLNASKRQNLEIAEMHNKDVL